MATTLDRVLTSGITSRTQMPKSSLTSYLLMKYNEKYNYDYIIKFRTKKLVNNNNNKRKIVNFNRIYHHYADIVFLYNWLRFR